MHFLLAFRRSTRSQSDRNRRQNLERSW